MSWSDTDFQRLDEKLDRLTEAVTKLAANERRLEAVESALIQLSQDTAARHEKLSEQERATRAELDKWRYLVLGGWAVIAFALAVALKHPALLGS